MHNLPKVLAKSFVVSVLPVPAGPAGAPPKFNLKAPIKVKLHLSVSGVMTKISALPTYSYPYGKSVWTDFTTQLYTSGTKL